MEKPLFNLRSQRNYLRYHYFYGYAYYFVQSFEFTVFGILIVILTEKILDQRFTVDSSILILIVDGICFGATLLIQKVTLNPPIRIWILTVVMNTILAHFLCYGLLHLDDLRGLTLSISLGIYLIAASRVGRINLYPDRMEIIRGWRKLYSLPYAEVRSVLWASDPVSTRFPAEAQKIPIIIVTPIELETQGEDFTIYHYYVYISTEKVALILQPLLYRSQFAQNAYNGWIEEFRWGGENVKLKVPPNGWEPKPHPKPY